MGNGPSATPAFQPTLLKYSFPFLFGLFLLLIVLYASFLTLPLDFAFSTPLCHLLCFQVPLVSAVPLMHHLYILTLRRHLLSLSDCMLPVGYSFDELLAIVLPEVSERRGFLDCRRVAWSGSRSERI